MKWYKKQLDQLKASKPELFNSDKEVGVKKSSGYAMDERKKWVNKKKFPDPVAASKLTRKKTDLP
ncbi:MAG: hypothetical protein A2534_04490 [Candidatus Magasanikbacteria bacterium RIFOXYD2_FULL_39_9]|uniref:Uncharacterized protein n=1 Tax=Candidatus Magasanikbacteria bacterium RIFOXYD1_FULL_40_23 TaxID=1798705 RepID=A0A1F6P7I7_9BACT|nr:MAG: hypothetical protein A2534_04490 [Candidatus Magasanikbacteria bacterium RIFOXYD2_FULL_39_9]OGH92078.1 MAG: hypothetical protein A2563_00615 [Candidatus Magasanikbacteria bacterium RIFOXYD1_FULL_40_23]